MIIGNREHLVRRWHASGKVGCDRDACGRGISDKVAVHCRKVLLGRKHGCVVDTHRATDKIPIKQRRHNADGHTFKAMVHEYAGTAVATSWLDKRYVHYVPGTTQCSRDTRQMRTCSCATHKIDDSDAVQFLQLGDDFWPSFIFMCLNAPSQSSSSVSL